MPSAEEKDDGFLCPLHPDELAEAVAGQLLARWGVVFRDLLSRESLAISWRDILWALRRLEARVSCSARHVAGFTGEQFALPEAAEQLRSVARHPSQGLVVQLSAADPLNLTGVILPGPLIPAQRGEDDHLERRGRGAFKRWLCNRAGCPRPIGHGCRAGREAARQRSATRR